MRAKLESIAQSLASEIEATGTIAIDGKPLFVNSILGQSQLSGVCQATFEKLARSVKDAIPNSQINKIYFTKAAQKMWDCSQHVIAEVIRGNENYWVDPTIEQYIPGAQMVYSEEEEYPIIMIEGSMRKTPYTN